MKALVLFVALFVGLDCVARCATSPQLEFAVGMNAANSSTNPNLSEFLKDKVGFRGGINLEVPIDCTYSFQPELWYVQKGNKLSISDETLGVDVSGKVNLDYVEVPLLIKGKFGKGRTHGITFLGPYLGFNVANSISTSSGTQVIDETKLSPFDAGLTVGLGFETPVSDSMQLNFSARYSVGLSDIVEGEGRWNHRGFSLQIGLQFGGATRRPAFFE